jgi:hypothetical protein
MRGIFQVSFCKDWTSWKLSVQISASSFASSRVVQWLLARWALSNWKVETRIGQWPYLKSPITNNWLTGVSVKWPVAPNNYISIFERKSNIIQTSASLFVLVLWFFFYFFFLFSAIGVKSFALIHVPAPHLPHFFSSLSGGGLVFALRPQTPKHIRGGWSHYTDTSEPVDRGVQLWTTGTILSVKMDREYGGGGVSLLVSEIKTLSLRSSKRAVLLSHALCEQT